MNIVDAIKAAWEQGKDVIEDRVGDRVHGYASITADQPWMNLITADVWPTMKTIHVSPRFNDMCINAFLSDDWHPSEMKRQTLLDIQQSIGNRARY